MNSSVSFCRVAGRASLHAAPFRGLGIAVALTLTLLTPARAQGEVSIEQRLTALEAGLEALARENRALRAALETRPAPPGGTGVASPPTPSASSTATTPLLPAVVPGGREAKLVLGGFVQVNAEFGGAPDARWSAVADRFFVRRARLAATATFAEHFTARLEGAFGAESLTPRSANSVQAMDAYVQWSRDPALVVRAGQFKSPFGYEQLTSDLKGFLIERTLANDRLTVGRQIGVGAAGETASRRFNYAAGLFNGNGTNAGANDNDPFLPAARLGVVAWERGAAPSRPAVRWSFGAGAFTHQETGALTGRRSGWAADSQLVIGPAELWAEWLRQDQRPAGGPAVHPEGWSLLGAWLFQPGWQGAVRFEAYDANPATSGATTRTWTFGVNRLLKGDDLKLSLNYVRGTPPAPQPPAGRWIGRMQVIF